MTAKNTSIARGKPYVDFARRKVESGEFGSHDEVVREAMRRYIAEDTKLETLRHALIEGENSGTARALGNRGVPQRDAARQLIRRIS